jgi:hypothetical protein
MKHSSCVILDTALRSAWYSNGRYPLSEALLAAGRIRKHCPTSVKIVEGERVQTQWKLV